MQLHPPRSYPPTQRSASFDATVRLWDPLVGKCKATLSRHGAMIYTVAFSADGEFLASGSGDGSVVIWSARDGSVVRTYAAPSGVFDVVFDGARDRLAVCCSNAAVAVVDLRM